MEKMTTTTMTPEDARAARAAVDEIMAMMARMGEIQTVAPVPMLASPDEADLLARVDADHLADAILRLLPQGPRVLPAALRAAVDPDQVAVDGLPAPYPRAAGVAGLVKSPQMRLPLRAAILLRPGLGSTPGCIVRGALRIVLDDYDQGRYELSDEVEDARTTVRMALPGAHVQRAAWRVQGRRRAGNRPGQWLWAGLGEGKGRSAEEGTGPRPLWEFWHGPTLIGVIEAPSLFAAAQLATTMDVTMYMPELLDHMQEIRADRTVADQYRV